jgi:hypothetical protein
VLRWKLRRHEPLNELLDDTEQPLIRHPEIGHLIFLTIDDPIRPDLVEAPHINELLGPAEDPEWDLEGYNALDEMFHHQSNDCHNTSSPCPRNPGKAHLPLLGRRGVVSSDFLRWTPVARDVGTGKWIESSQYSGIKAGKLNQ